MSQNDVKHTAVPNAAGSGSELSLDELENVDGGNLINLIPDVKGFFNSLAGSVGDRVTPAEKKIGK